MKCPRCGHAMSMGAPHSEGDAYQWECHSCGKVMPVGRDYIAGDEDPDADIPF